MKRNVTKRKVTTTTTKNAKKKKKKWTLPNHANYHLFMGITLIRATSEAYLGPCQAHGMDLFWDFPVYSFSGHSLEKPYQFNKFLLGISLQIWKNDLAEFL